MWKTDLKKYLGLQAYTEWNRVQQSCPSFLSKVALARSINYEVNQVREQPSNHQVLSWLLDRENMKYRFVPVNDFPVVCSHCGRYFTRHIELQPCKHILCDRCMHCVEHTETCVVCHAVIQNIVCDSNIIEQQRNTLCKCEHSQAPMTCSLMYQELVYITEDNFERFASQFPGLNKQVFEDIAQIQKQPNYRTLNCMRRHILKRSIPEKDKAEVNKIIQEVATGQPLNIQLYTFQENSSSIYIQPCEFQALYKDMDAHALQCPHRIVDCPNPGCMVSLPAEALQLHYRQCKYEPMHCPLCLRQNIPSCEMTRHIIECITDYKRLSYYPERRRPIDVEFECRLRQLVTEVNVLSTRIIQLTGKNQKEVQRQVLSMLRPRRHVRYNAFIGGLYKVYKSHVVGWTGSFQVFCIVLFDILSQFWSLRRAQFAACFAVAELVNLVLFFVQLVHFMDSSLYKAALYTHMLKVYVAVVVDFACLYAFLFECDWDHFSNIRHRNIYSTVVDMLYFSAITGAKSGFGDVHANTPFCRALVFVQILFSIFTLYIVFRGSSFYFKIMDFTRQTDRERRSGEFERLLSGDVQTAAYVRESLDEPILTGEFTRASYSWV